MKKVDANEWLQATYPVERMRGTMLEVILQRAMNPNDERSPMRTLLNSGVNNLVSFDGGGLLIPVVYSPGTAGGVLSAISIEHMIEKEVELARRSEDPTAAVADCGYLPFDNLVEIQLPPGVEVEVYDGEEAGCMFISRAAYITSTQMSISANRVTLVANANNRNTAMSKLAEVMHQRMGEMEELPTLDEFVEWHPMAENPSDRIRPLTKARINEVVVPLMRQSQVAREMMEAHGVEDALREMGLIMSSNHAEVWAVLPRGVIALCEPIVEGIWADANREFKLLAVVDSIIARQLMAFAYLGFIKWVNVDINLVENVSERVATMWTEVASGLSSPVGPDFFYPRLIKIISEVYGRQMVELDELFQ